MYVEASDVETGEKARLILGDISAGHLGFKCLTFYYHMFGGSVGTLNVYQYTKRRQRKAGPGLIWSQTGMSRPNLYSYNHGFDIIF